MMTMMDDFGTMVSCLKELREDQLRALINYELSTRRRASFLERLHMRYTKLRAKREREELMQGVML